MREGIAPKSTATAPGVLVWTTFTGLRLLSYFSSAYRGRRCWIGGGHMSKPYRVCPKCGAHLDHGEPCDCEDRAEQEVAQGAADTAALGRSFESGPRLPCSLDDSLEETQHGRFYGVQDSHGRVRRDRDRQSWPQGSAGTMRTATTRWRTRQHFPRSLWSARQTSRQIFHGTARQKISCILKAFPIGKSPFPFSQLLTVSGDRPISPAMSFAVMLRRVISATRFGYAILFPPFMQRAAGQLDAERVRSTERTPAAGQRRRQGSGRRPRLCLMLPLSCLPYSLKSGVIGSLLNKYASVYVGKKISCILKAFPIGKSSVEEIWIDKDGIEKREMIVGPHGDVC